MAEDAEGIRIDKCPLCGRAHFYPKKVERSTVSAYTTFGNESKSKPKAEAFIVKRLFHCPKKNEDFVATLRYENGGDTVVQV